MTPAIEVVHPDWCDPAQCQTQAHLVHHRSRPAIWTVEDGHAEVHICRSQYDAGKTTCQLTICRHDVHESVTIEWGSSDTEQLAWVHGVLTSLSD
jgi:hypothetical protein